MCEQFNSVLKRFGGVGSLRSMNTFNHSVALAGIIVHVNALKGPKLRKLHRWKQQVAGRDSNTDWNMILATARSSDDVTGGAHPAVQGLHHDQDDAAQQPANHEAGLLRADAATSSLASADAVVAGAQPNEHIDVAAHAQVQHTTSSSMGAADSVSDGPTEAEMPGPIRPALLSGAAPAGTRRSMRHRGNVGTATRRRRSASCDSDDEGSSATSKSPVQCASKRTRKASVDIQ